MSRDLQFLLLAVLAYFVSQTMVQVLVPLVAAGLGIASTLIGVLVALPGIVGLMTDLPSAAFSDAHGRREVLIAASLLGCLSSLGLYFANTFELLALAMAGWSVSASFLMSPLLAQVSEASPAARHARIQGYNGAVQRAGYLGGALLAGFLPDARQGLLAVSLLNAVVGVSCGLSKESRERASAGRTPAARLGYPQAFAMLATRRGIQISAGMSFLNSAVILVIGNSFVPLYFVQTLALPAVAFGGLLAIRYVFAAGLSLSSERAVGLLGFTPLVLLTSAVLATSVLLIPVSAQWPVLALIMAVQGIAFAFGTTLTNLLVISATSSGERAVGFACLQLASRLATVLFPLALGWLFERGPAADVFVAGGFVCLACVVGLLQLTRRLSQTESAKLMRLAVNRST